MKKPPPTDRFPHRPINKDTKSYDFLVQMILAGVVMIIAIVIITEKGCSNEAHMEHKDKAMDSESRSVSVHMFGHGNCFRITVGDTRHQT